jgi:xanthine dehydrogenase iron-sulfur cluster and FAD-binding subunit A
MFASRIQDNVEVKGGTIVTVRKLSGRSLEKAREAKSSSQLASLSNASGELIRAMRSDAIERAAAQLAAKREAEANDPKARAKARYDAHDREVVLNAGIVRWSCEEKVNPDNIADLDEDVAQQLHEAILDLSLPSLDPVEAEAVEGKG